MDTLGRFLRTLPEDDLHKPLTKSARTSLVAFLHGAETDPRRLEKAIDLELITVKSRNISSVAFYLMRLGPVGARMLAARIVHPGNRAISNYYLGQNMLTDTGACAIAEACQSLNNPVQVLDLGQNQCTNRTAEALGESIRHANNQLLQLLLAGNPIGDEGVHALTQAMLHHNSRVTRLDLRFCGLTVQGARELCAVLTHPASTLRRLDIPLNPDIGDEGLALLCRALDHSNCRLHALTITVQEYSNQALLLLAQTVKKSNINLVYLSSYWGFHPFAAFAETMYNNWFAVLLALVSVHVLDQPSRNNGQCFFRMIPKDLLRTIAQSLGWTFPEYKYSLLES